MIWTISVPGCELLYFGEKVVYIIFSTKEAPKKIFCFVFCKLPNEFSKNRKMWHVLHFCRFYNALCLQIYLSISSQSRLPLKKILLNLSEYGLKNFESVENRSDGGGGYEQVGANSFSWKFPDRNLRHTSLGKNLGNFPSLPQKWRIFGILNSCFKKSRKILNMSVIICKINRISVF